MNSSATRSLFASKIAHALAELVCVSSGNNLSPPYSQKEFNLYVTRSQIRMFAILLKATVEKAMHFYFRIFDQIEEVKSQR